MEFLLNFLFGFLGFNSSVYHDLVVVFFLLDFELNQLNFKVLSFLQIFIFQFFEFTIAHCELSAKRLH
jgi:hypothetical protein